MQSYLDVLGLTGNPSIDDIKKSYRKLAKMYHPDLHEGDTRVFLAIKKAYDYLVKNYKPELKLDNLLILPVTIEEVFVGASIPIQVKNNRFEKDLIVKIPKSIEHNTKLLYSGMGNELNGMIGDLYIKIAIQKHEWFEIDGLDVVYKLDVTYLEAQLGCEKIVPTVDGNQIGIQIKECESRKYQILPSNGLYGKLDDYRGDMVVKFNFIPDQHVNNFKLRKSLDINNS
jgi:DnaJ-class molecular chaperone